MRIKRIQNEIAESRFTLPFVSLYALIVCLLFGLIEKGLWIQFGCLTVSTYLMVELNNANSLIRIYSRIVSCSFLVLSVLAIFMLPSIMGALVQICFIVFYITVFHAYQDKQATGWIFYAFLAIGIASTMFIQILFFVPILWVLLLINVLALSARTFGASLLGLITPYWFVGVYYVYNEKISNTTSSFDLIDHFKGIVRFGPLCDISHITEQQAATFIYIAIIAIIGITHYLRNSYADKIRTRMIYEIIITVDICCFIFMILQPQHYDFLLRLMIINTAPLIGHFIALTHTWVTNISFYLIVLATLALTAFNLWMPSSIF